MELYNIFEKLGIAFEEIQHDPVFTMEQARNIQGQISGTGCKNLFLTDKKGKYILVILEENKKADIKKIGKITNTSRLSFAGEEELERLLLLKRGSVTPFGIINDTDNRVLLLIDYDLKDRKLLFHPNVNTKTISIEFQDLIRFIEYEKHDYLFIE